MLAAVWTSFLTKSIKDSKVVFLLGFGFHEHFFLKRGSHYYLPNRTTVVMDKVDYLEEANKQLTDERFYKKLDSDPTEEFITKITQELIIRPRNTL
jgi:hypothetical protein